MRSRKCWRQLESSIQESSVRTIRSPGERDGGEAVLEDPPILPGSLLNGGAVGEFYESCWTMAQAESFDAIRADPSKQVIMV